jgi:HAD superfamily hydrolase (TIGR01549 family)
MSGNGIKAVAFDLFGTLGEITRKSNPYGRVLDTLQLTSQQRADARRRLMCEPIVLSQIGEVVGRSVPIEVLIEAEQALYDELASVRLFHDTRATLLALRDAGFKIAIASNLAYPYSVPVGLLLPFEPHVCAWSFAAGAIKPDSTFYQALCKGLGCSPDEVLMIGDTRANDYEGAKAAGLHALHLNRGQPSSGEHIQGLPQVLSYLGLVPAGAT